MLELLGLSERTSGIWYRSNGHLRHVGKVLVDHKRISCRQNNSSALADVDDSQESFYYQTSSDMQGNRRDRHAIQIDRRRIHCRCSQLASGYRRPRQCGYHLCLDQKDGTTSCFSSSFFHVSRNRSAVKGVSVSRTA